MLQHVAAQVGFPGETTTTASNCALTGALWILGFLFLAMFYFKLNFQDLYIHSKQNSEHDGCVCVGNKWNTRVKTAFKQVSVLSLPLRCARSHAPSVSTAWWKSLHSQRGYSWAAAAADHRQVSHRERRSFCSDIWAPLWRWHVMDRPPPLSAFLIPPVEKA